MPSKIQRGQIREVPIDVGDGDVVYVKDLFTTRDRAAITAATVSGKIRTSDSGKEVDMGQLDLGAPLVQTLIQGITRWEGPGFCKVDHDDPTKKGAKFDDAHHHSPIEPTPQNIAVMFDIYAQKVYTYLEEKNPRPQKGSDDKSSKSSTNAA
jgi:hypothetical protein